MSSKLQFSSPVLVTGATGYVAGWIIKGLLDNGVTVHAAVRDPSNSEKIAHLKKLAQESKGGEIKFFKADLLNNGSYKEAMDGCTVVFHTASPFTSNFSDAQKDLVDPALKGTKNVLLLVNETPSVKRVVLTSSCAAVYGDARDLVSYPNKTLKEDRWNETSSLTNNPYAYSKTVAEKEAWKINGQQKRWDLVTINPFFVLGPGLSAVNTSESYNIMKNLGSGKLKLGLPDWQFGIVDVRDVADAHIKAAFLSTAKGRYIVSGHVSSLMGIANELRPKYGSYPLPLTILPKFLVWAFGPLFDKNATRKGISNNVGYPIKVDNSKSIKELGMKYRPLNDSITEFFQQMIDDKVF